MAGIFPKIKFKNFIQKFKNYKNLRKMVGMKNGRIPKNC